MSFTNYLENALLDHVFGAQTFTPPSSLWVGLSSTQPAEDGSNFTEPSDVAYARAEVVNNATNWPAALAGLKSNGIGIVFNQATAEWTGMAYFGIFDAEAGNLLVFGALDSPQTVPISGRLTFLSTALSVEID